MFIAVGGNVERTGDESGERSGEAEAGGEEAGNGTDIALRSRLSSSSIRLAGELVLGRGGSLETEGVSNGERDTAGRLVGRRVEGVVGLGISCLIVEGVECRCDGGVVAKREDWNGESDLLFSISEDSSRRTDFELEDAELVDLRSSSSLFLLCRDLCRLLEGIGGGGRGEYESSSGVLALARGVFWSSSLVSRARDSSPKLTLSLIIALCIEESKSRRLDREPAPRLK